METPPIDQIDLIEKTWREHKEIRTTSVECLFASLAASRKEVEKLRELFNIMEKELSYKAVFRNLPPHFTKLLFDIRAVLARDTVEWDSRMKHDHHLPVSAENVLDKMEEAQRAIIEELESQTSFYNTCRAIVEPALSDDPDDWLGTTLPEMLLKLTAELTKVRERVKELETAVPVLFIESYLRDKGKQ